MTQEVRRNWQREPRFQCTTLSLVLHYFFAQIREEEIPIDVNAFGKTIYDRTLGRGTLLTS